MSEKVKNILYLNFELRANSGVYKKIVSQCTAFKRHPKIGKVFYTYFIDNRNFVLESDTSETSLILKKYWFDRLKYAELYSYLIELVKLNNINIIYFRYHSASLTQLKFLKKIKKLGIEVFVEIPTYPFLSEKVQIASYKMQQFRFDKIFTILFLSIYEYICILFLKSYVNHIITFSNLTHIWGIETINISNGIDTKSLKPKKHVKSNREISLLFVGNVSKWHGLDKIVKGLHTYSKKEKHEYEIRLLIIGEGNELTNLKKLVSDLNLTNIEFIGFVDSCEIVKYYNIADIGIGTLAIHRKNISIDSSLKTREYFAVGMPCIGSIRDVQILNSPLKNYYLAFTDDESPIDIEKIIYFHNRMLAIENCITEIRQLAESCLDWKIQINKILN